MDELNTLIYNINKRLDDIYDFMMTQNQEQNKRLNEHSKEIKKLNEWKNRIIGALGILSIILSILLGLYNF